LSRIGVPNQEFLPQEFALSFLFQTLQTALQLQQPERRFSPRDAMSLSRTNLTRTHLSLDEQSFQGLLSAAFTIQEHNDRRKQARQSDAQPETRREPEFHHLCPHCGSQKPVEAPRCQSCGLDELRPGERMQRNWASMWLMSQEQGLGLDRPEEVHSDSWHGGAQTDIPADPGKRRPTVPAARKLANSGFLTDPVAAKQVAGELLNKTTASDELEVIQPPPAKAPTNGSAFVDASLDYRQLSHADRNDGLRKRKWPIQAATDSPNDLPPGQCDLTIQPLELPAGDISPSETSDSRASDALTVFPADLNSENTHAIETGSGSIRDRGVRPATAFERFADLRVTLRFHRADLYLGIAIFVAIAALLWPAAVSPPRATLSLWERALVATGIAEAPAAAIHFQGDPGIEVWVDTHTALYYCPGAEAYGKTADGQFSSQREAQMDRFQPASRSACE
jgi:ribosomal protein L40E